MLTVFSFNFIKNFASGWTADLQKNPDGNYKFGGIGFLVDREVIVLNRQAYDLLDYLGDIGGLIDALRYIVALVFSPLWNFNF